MAEVLSGKRQQILNFIAECQRDRGYPPSVREIGEAVGLASSATVHTHLAVLQREGYLSRDPSKPRAIQVHYDPDTDRRASARRPCTTCRWSATWPPAPACWPRRTSRSCCRCPSSSPAPAPRSCCGCAGTPWSTPASSTATTSWCASSPRPTTATSWWPASPTARRRSRRSAARRARRAHAGQRGLRADGLRRADEVTIFGKVVTVVRQLIERRRRRDRLLEQARQAAVGQHLAARLARRAVRHLVGLERHPAQRVAARASGRAGRSGRAP